jgi:DNA-binding NarL/FixJ family response regulator
MAGAATPSQQTVLLVDDDSMVRGWVRLALNESEFRLAGEAATAAEGIELVERRGPDVLLVDYRLGETLGTSFVRQLRERGIRTPAVIMTANPERGFNEQVRDAGAQGSVLKTGSVGDLLAALRNVVGGELSFDARHPKRPPGRGALSPRERDVLRRIANGATNREIAEELGIGEETVKTLLSRSCAKLGVRRRAEAVSAAHKLGLL